MDLSASHTLGFEVNPQYRSSASELLKLQEIGQFPDDPVKIKEKWICVKTRHPDFQFLLGSSMYVMLYRMRAISLKSMVELCR